MKRSIVPALVLASYAAAHAQAALRVVATTSDLAAVATAVGGDKVKITVLAPPTADPHAVVVQEEKTALASADVLLEAGADMENAWLPGLVEASHNAKIAVGAPGQIVAAEGIELIDAPQTLRSGPAERHPAGNPHFMMSPAAVAKVAEHVAATLCALDAPSCSVYRANLQAFDASLDKRMMEWMRILAPFRGSTIVTAHPGWDYFAWRFGMKVEAADGGKPGKGKIILVEPYQSRPSAEALAMHTGAVIVDVCQFPGGLPGTDGSYFALMDADVKAIAAGFKLAKK